MHSRHNLLQVLAWLETWGRHPVCRFERQPAARNTGHGCPENRPAGSLTHISKHALVFALALIGVTSAMSAEPTNQVSASAFALALYDSHAVWGGRELVILTNGTACARVMRPPQGNEKGLQERRYQIQLPTNELQSLRALLDQHQFLTLTVTNEKPAPDERGVTISLRLAAGERRDVVKWPRPSQAGFTAIHHHLLDIVRRAEKTPPVFQGRAVSSWTPEGFVR